MIGSRARLICRSAIRRSRRSPSAPAKRSPAPDRLSSITGSSDGSKRRISGRSACSGSRIRSSFSSESWIASDIGVSQLNSSTTSLTPARLMLDTRRSPPTTPSASSTGRLTSFSTSSGAAPGYSVRTVIVG